MQLSNGSQEGWLRKARSVIAEGYDENVIFQRFLEVTEEMVTMCICLGYSAENSSS